MRLKQQLLLLYVGGLILLPVVLWILPADFFDHGKSVCLSVLLLDIECYGCGMTRAVQHLIHFDFAQAALYNKLSFIALPLLIIVWVQELIRIRKKIKHLNSKVKL